MASPRLNLVACILFEHILDAFHKSILLVQPSGHRERDYDLFYGLIYIQCNAAWTSIRNTALLHKTTASAFKQVYCFANREQIARTGRRDERKREKSSRKTLSATWEAVIMRVGLLKKDEKEEEGSYLPLFRPTFVLGAQVMWMLDRF